MESGRRDSVSETEIECPSRTPGRLGLSSLERTKKWGTTRSGARAVRASTVVVAVVTEQVRREMLHHQVSPSTEGLLCTRLRFAHPSSSLHHSLIARQVRYLQSYYTTNKKVEEIAPNRAICVQENRATSHMEETHAHGNVSNYRGGRERKKEENDTNVKRRTEATWVTIIRKNGTDVQTKEKRASHRYSQEEIKVDPPFERPGRPSPPEGWRTLP